MMVPVATQGPLVLVGDPDRPFDPSFIVNLDTGKRSEAGSLAATMARGYWQAIDDEPEPEAKGLGVITKGLSRAFGSKRQRQAQLVARLKRKRNYAAPVRGGTGKQGRTRRQKFAKHPGPGGSDLHSSGSDQSVHGGRVSALSGSNVEGIQIVAETMTMKGLPEDLQDKIRETLATRWTDGMTQADVEKNYAKVLAYAEELYAADPSMRDRHRFYERWFDVFEDHALDSKYSFKQIAGAGAAMSPGLEAETNLLYVQEMAEILAEDPLIPDSHIKGLNTTLANKRKHALADHFPDDYEMKSKAGKPKKPSPERAKDWEFTFEKGMRLSDVTNPHAALMAIRNEYNGRNKDGPIPKFFAPKGYDSFAKAVEILRGADIDATLTGGKVRSFYNNFLDPTNLSGANDVTIDFQMMEAALWVGGGSTFPQSLSNTPMRFNVGLGIRPILGDAVVNLLPEWGPYVGAESPAQLQEIIWATWKHGKDTGKWGDLPVLKERK